MSRVRIHTGAAFLGAMVLGVLAAGPAAAFTPEGTATLSITSTNPARESAMVTIAGECPAGATHANVTWTTASQTLGAVFTPSNVDGTFGNVYDVSSFVGRGTFVTFSLSCTDDVPTELATAVQEYTTPDFGQTLSVPASVALTSDIIITVDCGVTVADQLYITHYLGDDQLAENFPPYTGPGTYNLGTPASLGFAVGNTDDLGVSCTILGDTSVYASTRIASFAVVADAVIVTPPVDPEVIPPVDPPVAGATGATGSTGASGGRGASLADTGAELGWMAAASVALGLAGIGLLVRTRSRGFHA